MDAAHHFIQHWFNLADLACEEALYDSASLHRFVGIDLGREPVPDATTLLKFRRRLFAHDLGEALFVRVAQELQAQGIKINTGTIVDASTIGAPSSTKNADRPRPRDAPDEERPAVVFRHEAAYWRGQPKRADAQRGGDCRQRARRHVHDNPPLARLTPWGERRVYGDSAYQSQKALIASKAPRARDFTNERTRRGGIVDDAKRVKNRNKSRIRARVEHVFAVVKRLWGFNKVRYRGLQKNTTRAFTALALANIYPCRGRLLGQVRP
jgi:IS5 family transposase